jgi:hypothetical protein
MTDAEVVRGAVRAAIDAGHPRRRIRFMDTGRIGGRGSQPRKQLVILRITWSRRLLFIHMDPYDPHHYEIHTIRLFSLRRR